MSPIVERLGKEDLVKISQLSMKLEWGRRKPEYSLFWWPGRRLVGVVRALLASIAVETSEPVFAAIMGDKDAIKLVRRKARQRLVLDPFAGGGTIPLEAVRLGFDSIGYDSNPYAVLVSRASARLLSGECREKLSGLWRRLRAAWRSSKALWCGDGFCIIQVLLAACPPCEAPAWVSKGRGGFKYVLDENLELHRTRDQDLTPREPKIKLTTVLPEEAPGYVAYSAEVLLSNGDRLWVSLGGAEGLGGRVAEFLRDSMRDVLKAVEGIPDLEVPGGKETRKLLNSGIKGFRAIYSPRQLATIHSFLAFSDDSTVEESIAIAGTATRTSSLLSFYYQPAGRINPGLVVKSFWLPQNPAMLNPLASSCMPLPPEPGCRPVGRGGLVSLVLRYERSCKAGQRLSRPRFFLHDSRGGVRGGISVYSVFTDPPYPGMQSYRELTLVYAYPYRVSLGSAILEWDEIDPMSSRYPEHLSKALLRLAESIVPGGYSIVLISAGSERGVRGIAEVLKSLNRPWHRLMAVYPMAGESPGRLGRSSSRLVLATVYKKGGRPERDPVKPLEWAREVGEAVHCDTGCLKKIESIVSITSSTLLGS